MAGIPVSTSPITAISPNVAAALEEGRSHYNALFAQARRVRPRLDMDIFLEHIATNVAPIVDAVAAHNPDAVAPVLDILYTLSLEAVGAELLGSRSHYPKLAEVWSATLVGVAQHLVTDAPRLIPSLTNALYNIALVPDTNIDLWSSTLQRLAPITANADKLLACGTVAAWRCGMAHYRSGALAICRSLTEEEITLALGIEETINDIATFVERLEADPWYDPTPLHETDGSVSRPNATPNGLHIRAAGGFRGLGGIFSRPPTLVAIDDGFYISDGTRTWLMSADCFGTTFVATEPPPTDPHDESAKSPFSLDKEGRPRYKNIELTFLAVPETASIAYTSTTLAVTRHLAHRVFLLAPTAISSEITIPTELEVMQPEVRSV